MKIVNSTKLLIVAIMAIAFAITVAEAQVGPGMTDFKTARGLSVVSNDEGNYFKMEIEGKEVSRLKTRKKYWYTADGVRFEFFSEENSKFVMTNVPVRLGDDVILRLYRSEFLRRQSPDKPKLRSSWLTLANGKRALLWSYDHRPASPKPVTEKQIFIVITDRGHTYGLFATVPAGAAGSPPSKGGVDAKRTRWSVRRVLVRTLGSLTFSDEPF